MNYSVSVKKLKYLGQVPCCVQRVLINPTSTLYVNIATQGVVTPARNQYDAPVYQNPYGYQVPGQGTSNTIVMGHGPTVINTQTTTTTKSPAILPFGVPEATTWNGNQTGYVSDSTLTQIYRDPELNEQRNLTNVNGTFQSTTQNINQYYQGANAGWSDGSVNNNSSTQRVNNNNNVTISSTQGGNNTIDPTTSEFSDSGYIQVSGNAGPIDIDASGEIIDNQKPYNGTTIGTILAVNQHNDTSTSTTGIYHNANDQFGSSTQVPVQSNGQTSSNNQSAVYHNANTNFGDLTQSTTTTSTNSLQNSNYNNANNSTSVPAIVPLVITSNPQENTQTTRQNSNSYATETTTQHSTQTSLQNTGVYPYGSQNNQQSTTQNNIQNTMQVTSQNNGQSSTQATTQRDNQNIGPYPATSQNNEQSTSESSFTTEIQSTTQNSFLTNDDTYSSTTPSTIGGTLLAGIGAGVATIGGAIGAAAGTVSNATNAVIDNTQSIINGSFLDPSSTTFNDADIAPLTQDSDYKYSDSGYITVGISGDNATTTNQSGNNDNINSNANNNLNTNSATQGTTQSQGTSGTESASENNQGLSTQFNQDLSTLSTLNQDGSTQEMTNNENTEGSSTLMRDSTLNDGRNELQNEALTSTDSISEQQNSAFKISGKY
uniref:DUF4774 domain-containing protein n=1 Tax=Parastrongyloides trichosuri TaxID=131310 RepID=A0A0N4ZIT3_PARTI